MNKFRWKFNDVGGNWKLASYKRCQQVIKNYEFWDWINPLTHTASRWAAWTIRDALRLIRFQIFNLHQPTERKRFLGTVYQQPDEA